MLYDNNPTAAGVAELAKHRINEAATTMALDDPRRPVVIGLLKVIAAYMELAEASVKPGSVRVFRDVVGAVAKKGLTAKRFLVRTRDALCADGGEGAFREAAEKSAADADLKGIEQDGDDYLVARSIVLCAFQEQATV